jgi:hypothetical protein
MGPAQQGHGAGSAARGHLAAAGLERPDSILSDALLAEVLDTRRRKLAVDLRH